MSTCWVCGVTKARSDMCILQILAHPGDLPDLSVMICSDCNITLRRTLADIRHEMSSAEKWKTQR